MYFVFRGLTLQLTKKVVSHIERFTSLQDQELIAFSLLQSVEDILAPPYQCIIRRSKTGKIVSQFILEEDQKKHKTTEIKIPDRFADLLSAFSKQKVESHSEKINDHYYFILMVNHSPSSDLIYLMERDREVDKFEYDLLSGLFQVFKNFIDLIIDSQTDQLTGLLNRKTFDTAITRFWEYANPTNYLGREKRQERENEQNYVVVFDIDHFKRINDDFGHLFGDEVLILVANKLRDSFRSDDFLFRFGGEEFVLLLKGITQENCEALLNKVHQRIAETEFPNITQLTISSGVCALKDNIFYMTILDYADKALYESKKNGRNQATFFNIDEEVENKQEITGEIDLF